MNRFHTFRCKYSKLYVLPPDKKQEKSDYCTYIPLINYGGSIERSLHALCLVEMTIEGMISRDDSSGICHVERSREISPRASLSRDDRKGCLVEMTSMVFVMSSIVETSHSSMQSLCLYGIRSMRSSFFVSIRASFFALDHFLSCFSRAMARSTSEYSSKYTSL